MKSTSKLAKIDLAVIAAERTPEIFEARKAACKALREFVPAAVKAVEDAVNTAVVEGRRVYATVEQLVEQMGRVDLAAVIGALVLMHSADGRIDPRAVEWARRTQYAPELAATDRVDTYRLHMAHLDNLASALMRWEREHPADAEPVEAEAVEAAPVADPAPVAAEAAPAEAEPVKVARKARKPRKAAPVADPAPVVDEVEVAAATRIKEQDARRGEPQMKIPEGCTATVINGTIVAVSSCGDLTGSPAPMADAEPVKKARKPRAKKAAPVVEEKPAADPVPVAEAEPVEAEPVRTVAEAAVAVPVVEALTVSAPAADPAPVAGGWSFSASAVEVSGRVFPASYSVTPSGDVYAFCTIDGAAVRLHVGKNDALHAAALAAAREEADARKAARMEPAKVAPVVEAAPVAVDPAPVAEAVPAADPAPVAEEKPAADGKSWVGSVIAGDGWKIVFDGMEERTRVFCSDPSEAQRAAIEGAGFWWSPRMGSWNKKLTCKAYRAAVALAEVLRGIA